MKGDPLLLSSKYKKKVDCIVQQILKNSWNLIRNKRKITIAIGGISGTMKSETAYLLQEELYKKQVTSYCISLDDYYMTHWKERNQIRKETGIIGLKEIAWQKINKIIADFKGKEFIRDIPEINKFSGETDIYPIVRVKNIRVLIIEGLYALECANIDFRVFLHSTIKQTEKFRIERGKENLDEFRRLVLMEERKSVLLTKPCADLIINI